MNEREALKLAQKAMGLIGADLVCDAAHHEKKDRHQIGEPCPIQARWHRAFDAIKEALAQHDSVQAKPEPEQEPVAWTPVATAMPKSGVVVLACYKNSADKVRRIRAQWIAAKTLEANGEFEDWSEYDEEADTYWTPEGWYECIDSWDEYSSVFVHEQITHWMPLPADPYTTPPQRKPLTDEEISRIWGSYFSRGFEFARAIEAAHGIKE